jgi:hypothetical protein
LELKIFRNGKLVESFKEDNLVVEAGRNKQARMLGGVTGLHVTKIGFGSNGTDPAPGDTVIANMFSKNITAVSYPSTTQVRFSFVLTEAEANGLSIREFGLICADGTLYARRTRGGKVIDKDSDLSIEGQWTIYF